MNVTKTLLKYVNKGCSFNVDLESNTLRVKENGKYISLVSDGKYKGRFGIKTDRPFLRLEELYANYKYSSVFQDSRKGIFKALSSNDLELNALVSGEDREVARAKLESFVLGLKLSGFKWEEQPETKGKWFYQGKDPDLVLLKEWFE